MARIYKKNNSYYFSFEAGRDERTGKRQRIVRGGFRTKKEAQQASAELEVKFNTGKVIAKPSDITLHEFMWERWLPYHGYQVKPSSIHAIKVHLRRIDKYFNNIKLKDITTLQCNRFALHMLEQMQLSRNVVSSTIAYLKIIFKYAIYVENILINNPVDYVVIPKYYNQQKENALRQKKKPLYLEKETLKKFLTEAKKDFKNFPFYMATVLMTYTGMRIGEVLALQWDDIDLKNKVIHVKNGYFYLSNNQFIIQTPKTKTSMRDITIHDLLIKEITAYRKQFIAFKMRSFSWFECDYDFVLTSVRFPGRPFLEQSLKSWMHTIGKRIDIDYIHPHIFRHTHVSLLAEIGVPLEVIQERLGHANDTTTRQIYLHITKNTKNEAAVRFDKLMSKI